MQAAQELQKQEAAGLLNVPLFPLCSDPTLSVAMVLCVYLHTETLTYTHTHTHTCVCVRVWHGYFYVYLNTWVGVCV
jgi:hypothetical protein